MRRRLNLIGLAALILTVGLLTSACAEVVTTGVLPTRAAAITHATAAPMETAPGELGDAGLPATWTPFPTGTLDPARGVIARLEPTLPPSPTPLLPSRTATPTVTPSPTTTPSPSPTAEPTIPLTYEPVIPLFPPTDRLGRSKLSLHVIRNNDPNIMEFVRQARPPVIKAVDDLGFLREVKRVSPFTITVGRVDDIAQNYVGVPEEEARKYVARHLDVYQANRAYVDYWEGWNEPDPNMDRMWWYTRFEQERTREMARLGFRVGIGGFAAGVPEYEEFQLFIPAIQTALDYGGILTLHEYSAPDIGWLFGEPLPGLPAYPDRGALMFRYRWYYRDLLAPANLTIPLVISEAGVDGIIGGRPGPSGLGWRDFEGYWVDRGLGASGTEAFINQLAWYDAGVREDGYVIGFTVFTAGGFGQWSSYNINPILPDLIGYVLSQR